MEGHLSRDSSIRFGSSLFLEEYGSEQERDSVPDIGANIMYFKDSKDPTVAAVG